MAWGRVAKSAAFGVKWASDESFCPSTVMFGILMSVYYSLVMSAVSSKWLAFPLPSPAGSIVRLSYVRKELSKHSRLHRFLDNIV